MNGGSYHGWYHGIFLASLLVIWGLCENEKCGLWLGVKSSWVDLWLGCSPASCLAIHKVPGSNTYTLSQCIQIKSKEEYHFIQCSLRYEFDES